MTQVLVIAPHPDDETLGCGGTLLRHRHDGDSIHWLIATSMAPHGQFDQETIDRRNREIEAVTAAYGFSSVHPLAFPTCELDRTGKGELINRFSEAFKATQAETVYVPFPGDAHSDHKLCFEAAVACCKWFRYPSVRRVLAYQTLSETEFGMHPMEQPFRPNVYIDISKHLERKLEIMHIFASELGDFPFPRSIDAIRAQSALHGSTAGCEAAEAFMLIKEVL